MGVCERFGQGEIGGEEGDEHVDRGPVVDICWSDRVLHHPSGYKHTFLENDHIAKDLDVDAAFFDIDQPGEDLAHGFAPSLDVHGTHAEHDDWEFGLRGGRVLGHGRWRGGSTVGGSQMAVGGR